MADAAVGVIGAGGSGIVMGAALANAGLDFEILEARDGIGGTWRYDPDGAGSACYASLVTNTSKLRTSLRSGRIAGRPWEYASHREMLAYLEGIAKRHGLANRTRLNWRVADAAQRDGEWVLRSDSGEQRRYTSLVCALGVNGRPRWAQLDGQFSGEQLHSASYRTPERFADRDVLVIGLGTSGCEIAGETAAHARSVTVAVRSPMWLMRRRIGGVPLDWLDNPFLARLLPWSVRRPLLAGFSTASTGRLRRYGVPKPTRRCGDDIIAISDSFPRAVEQSLIDVRPDVASVSGREVRFHDGSAKNVDIIVHATGFDLPTGFLSAAAQPDADRLYRGIAHTGVDGLHYVGMVEAHRALLPIVEAQAAWSAGVLAGHISRPDRSRQAAAARADAARRLRDFGPRHRHLVDHARYVARLKADAR